MRKKKIMRRERKRRNGAFKQKEEHMKLKEMYLDIN